MNNTLYSRQYFNDSNIKKLSKKFLYKLSKSSNHIKILSAYYSKKFFYDLFSSTPPSHRRKCHISIVVNGFAGFRLEEQIKELDLLEKDLKKLGYQHIEIYINTDSSLFHSKLYHFQTENNIHFLIGSANSSDSAFTHNEEILLHIQNDTATLETYIHNVIKNSILYKEIKEIKINSMIKFWRTGLIYYKPNTNIQFTYNRLKIPNWVKKELYSNQTPPPYSTPGEPWGPFNLKLALGFKDEEEKVQAKHSPWSIETCFGYWVPSVYKDYLDEKIESASKQKSDILHKISEKIKETGKENIINNFKQYISGIEENLCRIYTNYHWRVDDRIVINFDDEYYKGTVIKSESSKLKIKFDDGDEETVRKDSIRIAGVGRKRKRKRGISEHELKSHLIKEFWRPSTKPDMHFQNFITRISEKLEDERYINRASSPLISSTLPEIWNDSIAFSEFSESFYEYVSYKLNMPFKPKVVKSLQSHCQLEYGDDWRDVRNKIKDHIEQYEWTDDNWLT